MQHFIGDPRSESFVCGADAVGRRNTRLDMDTSETTCRDCCDTLEYCGAWLDALDDRIDDRIN